MKQQEFWIEYFDLSSDQQPIFQLSVGDVGGTREWDQDERGYILAYRTISSSKTFTLLGKTIIDYLKRPGSLSTTYQYKKFSEGTLDQLDPLRLSFLEEILALHNSYVTSRSNQGLFDQLLNKLGD